MAAAKFDGPMEYPVEGYTPVGQNGEYFPSAAYIMPRKCIRKTGTAYSMPGINLKKFWSAGEIDPTHTPQGTSQAKGDSLSLLTSCHGRFGGSKGSITM